MTVDVICYQIVSSPVGRLVIGSSSRGCCLLEFEDRGGLDKILTKTRQRYRLRLVESLLPMLDTVSEQLQQYFAGTLSHFDFPLHIEGTQFERRVWETLQRIPAGETTTYGDIASELGQPLAARAVGAANGRNSIAIVIPCHRVIEKNGGLRGYGGGLWRKRFLLQHEKSMASCRQVSLDL